MGYKSRLLLALLLALIAGPLCAQTPSTLPSPALNALKALSGDFSGRAALNRNWVNTFNPDTVAVGPGGTVSFCPKGSCIRGANGGPDDPAYFDHQRASLLVSATTGIDGQAQEQALAVTFTNNKGEVRPYAPNKTFSLGDNTRVGDVTYRAIQGGTTGANSAPPGIRPPVGASFVKTDGSVKWLWINDYAIHAKAGAYFEVINEPGGGQSWGQATNVTLSPGFKPTFNVATELNFFNASGTDCEFGINCIGLSIAMQGPNVTTAGLSLGSSNTDTVASIWGARILGRYTAREAALAIDASSKYGIAANQFNLDGGTTYSQSFLYDNSTAMKGIEIAGTKSSAGIEDRSTAPAGVRVSGSKSFAGIYEHSATPVGLRLDGAYGLYMIQGNGFTVSPAGSVVANALTVTGLTVEASGFVPPTSTSPCTTGQKAWDTSFEYRCVAPNTWKRAALSSW
ncbi:hypothetical protein DK412_09000 [Methylobacterium sp. 17Sr1-1]|nr:hypothetical protein DK412_09000 [Methylobacterium sp. 17Sr1-1]